IVAIGLAAEVPSAVRALVLEDPPLGAFAGRPFTVRPEHDRFVAMRDLAGRGLPARDLARLMLQQAPDQNPVTVRWRARSLSQTDPDALTFIIETRAIDNFILDERLRRITCPTLLFQGNPKRGGALSDAESDWAMARLADGLLVRIPEAGHLIHQGQG